MDAIGQFQHYSKYARFDTDKRRREHWPETVDRVVDFFVQQRPVVAPVADELRQAMLTEGAMPSMRSVQMAGAPAERCNVSLYNPVSGDTRVLTPDGMIAIRNLEGRDVTVLNKDGRWVPAKVRGYGEQDTLSVTFKDPHSSARYTVQSTHNHRWLKADGDVVPTSGLKVGDRVPTARAPRPEKNSDYYDGLRHGLVFGDGSTVYHKQRAMMNIIRICSDVDDILPLFDGYNRSYPPSFQGQPIVYIPTSKSVINLKDLPSKQESASYIWGFLCGWFAADGSVTKAGQATLCTSVKWLPWLSEMAPTVGWNIMSTSELPKTTNYGERKSATFRVQFYGDVLTADDMIIARKRANIKTCPRRDFVVESIVDAPRTTVFCAHVPDTNTFVLDNGLVTGNCAYSPIEDIKDMADALYILMQGTGFAFSVERAFINKLPVSAAVTADREAASHTIVVEDTTESWCDALLAVLDAAYAGIPYVLDVSAVRPAGARLVTKGGYASGPEPLADLCALAYDIIRAATGRRLRPFEVHRIMCKIGQIVQVGGVRRAAMLSLSDIDDIEMRECKNGAFWERYPELTMANNSAAYRTDSAWGSFDDEWANLVSGGSGERGIFNAQSPQPARRIVNPRTLGTNPCAEINLNPRQFCNLSIAIVRPEDTLDDLRRKVTAAAIFGTVQASFTNFRYIKPEWSANSKREALLGVDLQGALDNPLLQDADVLASLRQLVREVNQTWAERLRIARSAATTCIKPSGNSGERFGTGNSLTGWYAPFFERRVVIQKSEPLYAFLVAQGVPVEEHYADPRLAIFVFPKRAPAGATIRGSRTAIEQLEWWLRLKKNWTEHNPSATIYVRSHEWDAVAAWIRDNRAYIGGLSFLGFDDTVYKQAPYTPITEDEYNAAVARFPTVDWTLLDEYEHGVDSTTAGQEFACLGDSCTIG